ncbi:MAG: cation:proton antiporter subunit C [Thermoplasmata archaeon]
MIDPQNVGILIMLVGMYGLMVKKDLIKQLIAVNILSFGLVLFFIGVGYVEGGEFPIYPVETAVDPLPAALMITTLVVDVAITSLGLAMIIRINKEEQEAPVE